MKIAADLLGVTRQTVSEWTKDITERRREVRKIKALILSRSGWNNVRAAKHLGVTESQIRRDVKADITTSLIEDFLSEASDELDSEEFTEAEREIREELIFAKWSDEERELLRSLQSGDTIVTNMREGVHTYRVHVVTLETLVLSHLATPYLVPSPRSYPRNSPERSGL